MLQIMKDFWAENEKNLKARISKLTNDEVHSLTYRDLLAMALDEIYNKHFGELSSYDALNLDKITVIDDGEYQGTFIFMIPFNTYQPCASEYLMTYIWYGSCSGCDTMQGIQSLCGYDNTTNRPDTVDNGLLALCRDMIVRMIRPYNDIFHEDEAFKQVSEERE